MNENTFKSAVPQDRALQDRVIRFLTDPEGRTTDDFELMEAAEIKRALRFSHFLVRRFYRDRLSRAFRYSSKLLEAACAADRTVDLPEFEDVLDSSVLGSLATAKLVGELVVARLAGQRDESWWSELLAYERAFLLQLATSEPTPESAYPRLRTSTTIHRFSIRIAELLTRVTRDEFVRREDLAGEATLVFSRSNRGKVYVAELDALTISVLENVDGERNVYAIAQSLGASAAAVQRQLSTLAELGAVILPSRDLNC